MKKVVTAWDIPTTTHYQIMYWQKKKINQHLTENQLCIEVTRDLAEATNRLKELQDTETLFTPQLSCVDIITE